MPAEIGQERRTAASLVRSAAHRGPMVVVLCLLGLAAMAPASAGNGPAPDCQPPGPGPALRLDVLTDAMKCTAYGSPAIYAFDGSLRLRLDSPLAAWRLRVRSEDLLADGGRRISAAAVQMRVGEEWLPLDRALTVAHGGPGRGIALDFPLRLVTSRMTSPGTYTGCLLIGAETPAGDRVPLERVPLRVNVGARIHNTYSGNRIYFHYGIGPGPMTAAVQGRIDSEVPVCLTVSAEGGKAGELPMLRPMTSRVPSDAVLPLEWGLKECGAGAARPPDEESHDHGTLSWRLRSTPGKGEYELDCRARPLPAQPPGDYGQKLTPTVVPLM